MLPKRHIFLTALSKVDLYAKELLSMTNKQFIERKSFNIICWDYTWSDETVQALFEKVLPGYATFYCTPPVMVWFKWFQIIYMTVVLFHHKWRRITSSLRDSYSVPHCHVTAPLWCILFANKNNEMQNLTLLVEYSIVLHLPVFCWFH